MLNRRDLLHRTLGWSAGLAFEGRSAGWRRFELTTQVEVLKPVGLTKIWVPAVGVSDTPFQKTVHNEARCEDGQAKVLKSQAGAVTMVAAVFPEGTRPVITCVSRVSTRDWSMTARLKRDAANLNAYLQPTDMLPTDGIVREKAAAITKGAVTGLAKARAIYEWIVDNTFRDPKTRGCGLGNIRAMLETGNLGGKCADINALYVGLARAAGLPARDVYGIRLGPSRLGYQSLGAATEVVTKSQHCRAEVYLQDYGWVPVDPADVRKVVLEEPPGNRTLSDEMVTKARRRLFGSWEMNWMAYNYGQDVRLPGSAGGPVHFLMYPQAETSEGRVDSLAADRFAYKITARVVV